MAERTGEELDTEGLVLSAVRRKPGCSAWALSVLVDPPADMLIEEWRECLARELPKLHAAGKVQATRYGVGVVSYWPMGFDVPAAAGEVVA